MRTRVIATAALLAALAATPLAAVPAQAQPAPPAKPGAITFHEADADHDGRVTLDEVLACAKKRSGAAKPFRIAEVDRNGDGVLDEQELAAAGIKGFEGMGPISARELDITPDGYVSRADLEEYFRRKHREAFAKADSEGKGWVREPDFALFRF
jgi:hypothetical protein